ncbi:tripartite tricarboxylate transporter TctB family protein [Brevibacterium album]|uniref:tripartite tricarboxylate transporter TctB family protein n=1 Tax=Brevibacterium album TaxID=417948 RepID=UPI000401BE41|nr:tripartite tricarboxylate transporter TctB family protein [Brevibacterium album]
MEEKQTSAHTGAHEPEDRTPAAADGPPEAPQDEGPQQAGTLANLVSGIVVTLLGAGSLTVALNLGFGTLTAPRAGTWPAILSVLLIVLGLALMALSKTFTDAERITRRAISVGVGALSIVIAVQLMPVIGFEIPGFLLMVFWMTVLGREKLLKSALIAALAVLALYLIFVTGLSISIPHLF